MRYPPRSARGDNPNPMLAPPTDPFSFPVPPPPSLIPSDIKPCPPHPCGDGYSSKPTIHRSVFTELPRNPRNPCQRACRAHRPANRLVRRTRGRWGDFRAAVRGDSPRGLSLNMDGTCAELRRPTVTEEPQLRASAPRLAPARPASLDRNPSAGLSSIKSACRSILLGMRVEAPT